MATTRRQFLGQMGGSGVGLLGLRSAVAAPVGEAGKPPNILFLFSDDQRWDALGCMGNPVIQTPNLDALAREGVLFRNSFVTTSICAPNRACVLSGQYVRRHGIDDFFKTFPDAALQETYPALLRAKGYYTGFIGKWGIGDSIGATARGAAIFDYWGGASHQTNFWHERTCRYVTHDGVHGKTDNTCTCPPDARGRAGPHVRTGKANMKDPVHLTTDIIPAKVQGFLSQRDPQKPFCLSVFFKSPHGPLDFDPKFSKLYAGQEMPRPATATLEDRARRPSFFNGKLGDGTGHRWVRVPETLHAHTRAYYRLITGMDETIGKIRKTLEEQGVSDNTLILFTSDNGHFKGEFGLAGKWMMYEPSIRVPGIAYDPRLPPARRGRSNDAMIITPDFSATIVAAAGVPVPARYQGRSLLPLLQESDPPWREDWFYEHPYEHKGKIEPCEGVRTRRWKYTRYYRQKPVFEELFDLDTDPLERHNLAGDPAHKATLDQLRKRWQEYSEGLS